MTRNSHTIVFSVLLSLFGTSTIAEPVTPAVDTAATEQSNEVQYIKKTLEHDDKEYAWTIIIPPNVEKGASAILFLHGMGACGSDGQKHLEVGIGPAIEQAPESWPFVVIAPQKPDYADWDFHHDAVMSILDEAIEDGYTQKDRVAITGLSQGGRGTFLFAAMHPDRFVAAAPICGYAQVAYDEEGKQAEIPTPGEYMSLVSDFANKLADTPVWMFHGDADQVVPAICSRLMYEQLKSLEADVKYTELPGVDHNAWDPAYANEELGQWFKKHLLD